MGTGFRTGAWLALGLALFPGARSALGQLPSASTAGLGFADNYTAAARGYNAIALNPANLALPGNPDASLAFFPARALTGLGPVTLSQLADYSGKLLPDNVRSDWLTRIRAASSGEQGGIGADLTLAAVQVRHVGFQLSSTAHGVTSLNGDAAQLILYGNARNGRAQDLHLANSVLNGEWTSTAAFSYAHPFTVGTAGARLAVGAALKFTLGHALAYGRDPGSHTTADPLELQVHFPIIMPDSGSFFDNGGGIGMDLGGAYQSGKLTLSAALQNVFNTFGWNTDKLRFRSADAVWTADSIQVTTHPDQPFANAPDVLKRQVSDLGYRPVLLVGGAYRVNPRLVVDADVHHRFGDGGMQFDPQTQVGAGGEYRVLPYLPVRAGAAAISGGGQFGGGIGVELGTFSMSGAVVQRLSRGRSSTISMITLISSFPR